MGRKFILGFSLLFLPSLAWTSDIEVKAITARLTTRDLQPVACGEFVRIVSIDVYDRHGERARWSWQTQTLDVTPRFTDAKGTVEFEATKVPNKYKSFKTRNPSISVQFKILYPTLQDSCVQTTALANTHLAKNQQTAEWKRFGQGCSGKGVETLSCELVYSSADLQQIQAIANQGLTSNWSEETKALVVELKKGKSRDSALIESLIQNPSFDINSRFSGQGSHGFETIWSWYFSRFDANNPDEIKWMQLFVQRGANVFAKDQKLNSILHNLPSTYGAFTKLRLIESQIEDSHWQEVNGFGETPFARIASNAEEIEILDWLLSRPDRNKTLNLLDYYGMTPLGLFEFLHPHSELSPRMKKHQLVYDKLVAAGAKLNP